MKTKKCGLVAAFVAVLLVTALLVTTCDAFNVNGLVGGSSGGSFGGSSDSGLISFKLNLSDELARTIMPTGSVSIFNAFVVTIEPDTSAGTEAGTTTTYDAGVVFDGSTNTIVLTSTGDALDDLEDFDFALMTGKYDITVDAYITYTGSSDVIVANFEGKIDTDVNNNSANKVSIALKPVTSGTDTGEFTYTIQYDSDNDFSSLTTATLSVNTLNTTTAITTAENGGSPVSFPIDLGTTNTDTLDIPAGFYTVIVTLAGPDMQTVVYREVLHIYPDMTSTWTKDFVTLTSTLHTVTFTNFDQLGATPTLQYRHGNLLSEGTNGGTFTSTYSEAALNNTFMGWYTTASFTPGTHWIEATNKVFRTTTLYALWPTANNVAGVVTFSIPDSGNELTVPGGSFSVSSAALQSGSGTLALTINNLAAHGFSATDVTWYIGITPVATGTASYTIAHNPGLAYTDDFLLTGSTIYLTVQVSNNGTPYSKQIEITVAP